MKPLCQPPRSKERFFSDQSVTPGFSGAVVISQGEIVAQFSDKFRDWMFAYQARQCGYCGDHMGNDWSGNPKAHIDHIKPRRAGGSDLPPNLIYACRECNIQKRNDHYSTLKLKIALRRAGVQGLITPNQAKQLIHAGLLNVKPLELLHFETQEWLHIKMPEGED